MWGFGKIFDPTLRLSLYTYARVFVYVPEFVWTYAYLCLSPGPFGWRWASLVCSHSSSRINAHGKGVFAAVVRARES